MTIKSIPLRSLLFVILPFLSVLAVGLTAADAQPSLPKLVDLGAGKCIPCKQMKPILADLSRDYADQFMVVFIDVWENRDAGEKYGIRIIPTQIFFSAEGRELARHEGFMSKKDILLKWSELGVSLKEPAPSSAAAN